MSNFAAGVREAAQSIDLADDERTTLADEFAHVTEIVDQAPESIGH